MCIKDGRRTKRLIILNYHLPLTDLSRTYLADHELESIVIIIIVIITTIIIIVTITGPVLESLMGMKGLPSSSGLPLEDSSKGAQQGPRGPGRDERTAKENEVGEGPDKLSASPSYSVSHKGSGLV